MMRKKLNLKNLEINWRKSSNKRVKAEIKNINQKFKNQKKR